MTDEFTVERLRREGENLNAKVMDGIGDNLIKYADAWEDEVVRLKEENARLLEYIGDISGEQS